MASLSGRLSVQVEPVQRSGGPEERQSELGSGRPELPPGVQRDQVLDQREDQGTGRPKTVCSHST